MVRIALNPSFVRLFNKLKDRMLKEQILKAIEKIKENPEIGKPMRFSRKGTREIYISPYRLVYAYLAKEDKIVILDLYHKDKQ